MLSCGGAWIDLVSRTVSLEGFEVPSEPEDSAGCHQVSLAEGTVVRGRHRNFVGNLWEESTWYNIR